MRYIPWVALSTVLFVTMYFFINPHKIQLIWFLQNISEQLITESRNMILLGMVVTAFAMLIFCFLCEFVRELKRKESSVYRYAKILFEIAIICVLFEIFFLQVVQLKVALNGLPQDSDLNNPMGTNVALNVLAKIASFVFQVVPSAIAVVLLWQSKSFVGALQEEMLSPSHIATLKTISKISVLTIFCTLGSMIIENILLLALSGNLLNSYFNIEIPIGMLIVTCLILILSKIMLKSTMLNEESKLVI